MLVRPIPLDLAELRQRIEHAVAGIDHQMLVRVWQELDYRIHVCRITNGGHMETPVKYVPKLWEILYPLAQIFPPCLPWLHSYRLTKLRRDFWLALYIVIRKIKSSICLNDWEHLWRKPSQIRRHRNLNSRPLEARVLPLLHLAPTAVEQVVACALVTQRARVQSPVRTSFLGEVFSWFFLTFKTNVRKL